MKISLRDSCKGENESKNGSIDCISSPLQLLFFSVVNSFSSLFVIVLFQLLFTWY